MQSLRRTIASAVVASTVMAAALVALSAFSRAAEDADLTVHEWGTFTSVASADGTAAEWRPLAAPSELPCFVERSPFATKGSVAGTVRMETPVLYFYAPRETTVDVNVRFRSGIITEWFPHAAVPLNNAPFSRSSDSLIDWNGVRVVPGSADALPRDASSSHYYTARETNAAPVAVGAQTEKFLFYRGVGRFDLPVGVTVDGSSDVTIRNLARDAIGDVILFTNDDGRLRYEVRNAAGAAAADPPTFDRQPTFELQSMLVAHGLYPEEANAMVETWRDSWFEHGTRIFYVVPRRFVDSVLPLGVNPRPREVARVFVARTELITPVAIAEVRRALLADDDDALAKYGRFLDPIARAILENAPPVERVALEAHLQRARSAPISADRCTT
jgi:hypothetical protein